MAVSISHRKIFPYVNALLLTLVGLSMILPFIHIVAVSLSDPGAAESGLVSLWPRSFTIENYQIVLQDVLFRRSFLNSFVITICGTLVNLIMTSTFAYPLSRPELLFKRPLLLMVLFTFIFSAPMIPRYLLVRNLGMIDTYWALIIPSAISTFNFFVLRSFFGELPGEIIDSARVDGTGETAILLKIIIPLSKAALATQTLFYMVTHWNSYMPALMFINKRQLIPVQVRLREIIVYSTLALETVDESNVSPYALRMTTILIAILPIVCVYPFLQRYFVKGVTLGSLKE